MNSPLAAVARIRLPSGFTDRRDGPAETVLRVYSFLKE
jgi:hypothetical protein